MNQASSIAQVQIRRTPPAPLLFLPLGGAGEIGGNLALYGYQDQWLAIDCGLGFARGIPGVDQWVPDISGLEEVKIRPQALVITHGHEDHIGAIPWLWSKWRCPIYTTPFTAHLIRDRWTQFADLSELDLQLIKPLTQYQLAGFQVEWVPVTHSIPEAHSIYLKVAEHTLLHTGDWKLDAAPVVGALTASQRLQEIGAAGLDTLVCDSTNAPNAGWSRSEAEVQTGLKQVISQLDRRVVVTCFASNIARMYSLGQVAQATGRKITLLGRTMQRLYQAAKANQYLEGMPAPIPARDLGYLPAHEQLIVCTGSQGEPGSALARLAAGTHPELELEVGDYVLFSSKVIPGNELALEKIYNQLLKRGMILMTERQHPIHASGHPAQEEIMQLLQWLQPSTLIPVHGEYRHQHKNQEVAQASGITYTYIPHNGDLVALGRGAPRKVREYKAGRWLIDGKQLFAQDALHLSERQNLSQQGGVYLHLVIQHTPNPHVQVLAIDFWGLAVTAQLEQDLHQHLTQSLLVSLLESAPSVLEWHLQRLTFNWCKRFLAKTPRIKVHILSLN
ncbi:ribonuclease J [Allopseudospirillum japonicum]|uniref:Ribonuclease J n=1 Tax=Allopseudospirillum japonicum TaxID=64971 RepID=A0A1H6Q7K3_9GAMM|nr:ribonuclease J [Allopseudospirillum japonicum]SEI39738.1 ribonuclease J [Allopseudospirillum japonicum]